MALLRSLPALVLPPLLALSGCFRAVSVRPSDLRSLTVAEGTAEIVYKNGDTRRIARFDSLTVQARGPALAATPVEPIASHEHAEFEFEGPMRGSFAPPLLHMQDRRSQRVFTLNQLEEVTIERYAPERPWLILATATAGAFLGGLIGYSLGGPCDREWGCMGKAVYAMAGVPIGFGAGLAIGFPLTRGLGDFHRAERPRSDGTRR
jgi:hypothetical protein